MFDYEKVTCTIPSNRRNFRLYLAAEQGADARYCAAQITMDKLLHICAYITTTKMTTFLKRYANEFVVDRVKLLSELSEVPAEVVMSIKKKCSPRGAVCMLYT